MMIQLAYLLSYFDSVEELHSREKQIIEFIPIY
jgi:hypothetical protein